MANRLPPPPPGGLVASPVSLGIALSADGGPGRVQGIEIIGYADAVGPEDYNLNLSERRAEAVQRTLSSMGLSSNRMTTTGRGEHVTRSVEFELQPGSVADAN